MVCPLSTTVTSFFIEFATCGINRLFARLAYTGTYFIAGRMSAIKKFTVCIYGIYCIFIKTVLY